MPTGYTAKIADDITFEEFAWSCARAFGALVTLRDDLSAPIPDAFQASTYHKEKVEAAHKTLAIVATLTEEQCEKGAQEEFEQACVEYSSRAKEKLELKAKYEAMLSKVYKWKPPTPDHNELANFMINQLKWSIDFDCTTTYSKHPIKLSGLDWKVKRLEEANRDLVYHTSEFEKELERVHQRNLWLKELRDSIGPPPTKA